MRILVVQESDWMERGPHQNHHLMERLSKKGHEIRIIDFEILWREKVDKSLISKKKMFCNVNKATDGTVTVIRPAIVRLPIVDYISLIYTHHREIKRQINEFKPDIIVGFGILNAKIAIRLAKKNKIPFMYYIIDELHQLVPVKAFQILAKVIEQHNIKNANKVISINEGLREYTIKMGAEPGKTDIIRAGIDLKAYNNLNRKYVREKYGILEKDVVLFFMGWLYRFSGLKEVACDIVKIKNPNIKLFILGKGDLWDELQNIKKKYDFEEKIIMVDWVQYEDVPNYIAAADLCILPAYKNDIMKNIVPIKMYEYMAAEKAVITTSNYGIMKEFGDGNGVFYVNEPNEILNKAITIINNSKLEGLNSKKFVQNCSWEKMVNDFEYILEKSIKSF